jgi:hypothetical protein
MTVDWSHWMQLTEPEQKALWSQYRAIVGDEANRAKFNKWQRLDLAIRYPHSWRREAARHV